MIYKKSFSCIFRNCYSQGDIPKKIRGVYLPVCMNMMPEYNFERMSVYEDGTVYCNEFYDLEGFSEKLDSGRLSWYIPDNERIYITWLGVWTIRNGEWEFDRKTFFDHIISAVREFNPDMKDLFKIPEEQVKLNGHEILSEEGCGTPVKTYADNYPADYNSGKSIDIFYSDYNGEYYAGNMNIYKDNSIEICGIPEIVKTNYAGVIKMAEKGKILSTVPEGSTVNIYGLGKFNIESTLSTIKMDEKIREIRDIIDDLNGRMNSVARCREVLERYRENPCDELKHELKKAYEEVPVHRRIFIGDMDTKDSEIKEIIRKE